MSAFRNQAICSDRKQVSEADCQFRSNPEPVDFCRRSLLRRRHCSERRVENAPVPVIRRTSIHMVTAEKPIKPETTSKVCSHRGKGSDAKVLPLSPGENAIRRCRNVWLPHQLVLIHSRSIMVRSWSSSDICWICAGKPRAARVRWLITPSVSGKAWMGASGANCSQPTGRAVFTRCTRPLAPCLGSGDQGILSMDPPG